jgi:hypothetical protein
VKNIETFKRFMSAKSDNMAQAMATVHEPNEDWIAADRSMTNYLKTQLFIASLKYKIRKELMKNTYAFFQATYEAALDLEVIQQESKAMKLITMAAVTPP